MAITDRRIQSAKQRAIRGIMANAVRAQAANQTASEFAKSIISGDLAKVIAVACKPIQPISRVEVRKSEVTMIGEVPVAPAAEPTEEPETEVAEPVPEPEAPAKPAAEEPVPEELKPEDFENL
jgi:ribosomal protein S3AE